MKRSIIPPGRGRGGHPVRLPTVLFCLAATCADAAPLRCAHVAGGVVDNVVMADPSAGLPDGVDCSNPAAEIGWTVERGVYSAPAAAPRAYQTTGLSFLQFMALFAPFEQAAIVASNDVQVRLFLLMATGAESLDLANPQVVAGIRYLAALGLISNARAGVILSGAPPK